MIYLASASPRRQELLRQIGVGHEVISSNIAEVRAPGETPQEYVVRVALDKARHVAMLVHDRGLPERPVLGADTEVVLDGEVLGKPRDREHGVAMLHRLQGRTHEVLTAVVLRRAGRDYTALSRSRVTIAPMTAVEIDDYWSTGEAAGKAGAYAVQGRMAAFIECLEGSYSGVMGLPLFEVAQLFKQAGLKLL
jgi:septum formation protein